MQKKNSEHLDLFEKSIASMTETWHFIEFIFEDFLSIILCMVAIIINYLNPFLNVVLFLSLRTL